MMRTLRLALALVLATFAVAPPPAAEAGIRDRITRAVTRGDRAACTSLTRPIEVPGSLELDVFCYSATLDRIYNVRFGSTDAGRVLTDLPAGTAFLVTQGTAMEDGTLVAQRWRKVRFRTKAKDLIAGLATRDSTLKLARAYYDRPDVIARLAAAYPAEATLFAQQVDTLRNSMVEAGVAEESEASLSASKCGGDFDACMAKLKECSGDVSGCRAEVARCEVVVGQAHTLFELLTKHASAIEDAHHGPELLDLSVEGMKLTQ